MLAGDILPEKSASPLVRQGFQPLAQSSSRLKPTGKNESFLISFKSSIAILNDSDKFVGVVLIVPTPYLSGNRAWDCPYKNYANDARIAI